MGYLQCAGEVEGSARIDLAVPVQDVKDLLRCMVENGLVCSEPAKWVAVVRRHMELMFSRLENIPFRKYPVAGRWLNERLTERREAFWMVVTDLLRGAVRLPGAVENDLS